MGEPKRGPGIDGTVSPGFTSTFSSVTLNDMRRSRKSPACALDAKATMTSGANLSIDIAVSSAPQHHGHGSVTRTTGPRSPVPRGVIVHRLTPAAGTTTDRMPDSEHSLL